MFAVCCVDCNVSPPPDRTVTLVTTKPVSGPPLQLGRVNSDELLIVRSVPITVTGDPGDNTTGDSVAVSE